MYTEPANGWFLSPVFLLLEPQQLFPVLSLISLSTCCLHRKKKEAEAAAEEAAKQARLEAMQARMAAWQAQQAGAKQES